MNKAVKAVKPKPKPLETPKVEETLLLKVGDELPEEVAHFFEQNPTVNKFFFTSDGTAFEMENNAINHSHTLKDKRIKPIERPYETEATENETDAPDGEPGAKEQA